jgi:ribosomal protein S12 methylthiotransferase
MPTIGMISLGCDKNRINAEQMLWQLKDAGYDITDIPELADVVIVNTCSFIEAAKDEAIENILEIAAAKKKNRNGDIGGNVEKIIVTGCLAERYREEILKELPEVDGVVGCGSFDGIVEAVKDALEGEKPSLFGEPDGEIPEIPRFRTGPGYTAYIKVAEGCDNHCSYCVIPALRGRYRSRQMEHILNEARELAESGVRELILVAQDLTRYGLDLYNERKLPELLERLCQIEKLAWIRLHYLYPEEVTDELISTIRNQPKILRYLDIPIQHINDGILRRMNRRSDGQKIRTLIGKLRSEIEGVCIRTSIIVGFPGEDEATFTELCTFLKEAKIERAGFFAFSPEEGTRAFGMEDKVSPEVISRRLEVLNDIQDQVMYEYNCSRIGKVYNVLCEGYDPLIRHYYGRTYADSPEIDGKVFFTGKRRVKEGDFVEVMIEDVLDGELVGTML